MEASQSSKVDIAIEENPFYLLGRLSVLIDYRKYLIPEVIIPVTSADLPKARRKTTSKKRFKDPYDEAIYVG